MKTEIINEIETEIINDLKTGGNIKKESKETKTNRTCCLCKIEKIRDCFYTTGVYVRNVVQE